MKITSTAPTEGKILRRSLLTFIVIASLGQVNSAASAPTRMAKLTIKAVVVDKDLNLKPVPKMTILLNALNSEETINLSTNFDGIVEVELAEGRYHLVAPRGVEFQGKSYQWDIEFVVVSGPVQTLELSNDNAKILDTPTSRQRVVDDLSEQFKRLQNTVVTVWSEIAHGTGFIVDVCGLVLTNQHVVGPSEYIAVQLDEKRKVPAKLLLAHPEKDVAVIWFDPSFLSDIGVEAAPLFDKKGGEPPVVEGERVFTIGSPLSQRKIITSGIVSKVEDRAIISDININPGNSGGPLFSSRGVAVGITTFGEPDRSGPGLSGIVRIEEALPLLEEARSKMVSATPPEARLLPVEPKGEFPLSGIKAALLKDRFEIKDYLFDVGDYDVAVITPILKYRLIAQSELAAAREKEKRTKKEKEAVKGTFNPIDNLRNWLAYVGEYRPVVIVRASPKLKETFWSSVNRGLLATYGVPAPATMRFKADFYKMRLICGNKAVEPIQPAKIAHVLDESNFFVNITDATYEGFYVYPMEAFAPDCGRVALEIYSEKNPKKAIVKIVESRRVSRVWADFEPYRLELGK